MLEQFFKARVATASDAAGYQYISDALRSAGMKYYCKAKDIHQRNIFDASRGQADIGTFEMKPQLVAEIFVDKKNAELAAHIIHTL